jgi:hypothetical protein
MAYEPQVVSDAKAEITEQGMKLEITLPHKTFSSGSKGFMRMGVMVVNGVKYKLNLQVYKAKEKTQ